MYQCHDGRYWLLSFTVWEMIVWSLRAMLWLFLVEKSHLFKNPEKTWTEWLPSLEKLVVHHHPLEERLKDLICFLLIGYHLIITNTWLLYVPLFHLLKILVQESPPVARRVATVDRTPCSARGDSLLRVIHSTSLYYISLSLGFGNIDDRQRHPNINIREIIWSGD